MANTAEFKVVAGMERKRVAPHRGVSATEYMFVLGREEKFDIVDPELTFGHDRVTRRPFGQEFKKDSFAYIEVMRQDDRPDGTTKLVPIAIFNENHPTTLTTAKGSRSSIEDPRDQAANFAGASSSGITSAAVAPYANNFLIQNTNEVREEKFQLLETFGDNFVFFFGERPRFFDVTGVLLNSNSHRWKREWWLNYDTYLRGTKAVENKSLVTLHVDNVAISGYLLTSSTAEASPNPRQLQLTFRMLVTDYIFEDAPFNNLNYFAENLLVNKPAEDGGDQPYSMKKFAEQVETGLGSAGKYAQNAIVNTAIQTITQSVFGNPIAGLTTGIASAAAVFSSMTNNANIDEFAFFRQGVGSFVEYDGKAPGLYKPDGVKVSLEQSGIDNLVASVDNSLEILLNMERSPVVQSLSAIGGLIEGAINSISASQVGFATNSKQKYAEFFSRADKNAADGAVATGRYMGYDFTMPFRGLQIDTVNPAKEKDLGPDALALASADEDTAQAAIDAGYYGASGEYDFYVFSPTTGSDIDFDKLKKDPNYNLLPRSWRIRIEKDPESMSAKILGSSRRNSEDDLKMILRKSKSTVPRSSTLLERIDAEQGA